MSNRPADVAAEEEETGWKYIHGDVFRFPPQLSLFSACVGTGTQILVMAIAIFMLALVGVFYPYNRGALLSACVVCSLVCLLYLSCWTGIALCTIRRMQHRYTVLLIGACTLL